jgi:hypothetical protein
MIRWMGLLFWVGCGGGSSKEVAEDSSDVEAPLEEQFSFVVLADPHIAGVPEHEERLALAVEWINAEAEGRAIELVLVVGDIGWSSGVERSRELLDGLNIPYVPLMGDNEVQTASEERYAEVYASHFEHLAGELDSWVKLEGPVVHPESGEMAWLQNLRFEHRGVLFVGLDTVIRGVEGRLGELGSLNDFPGGSWPFLQDTVSTAEFRPEESIVIAGHVPIMLGALDVRQMAEVATVLGPVGEYVYAHFAGHLHIDHEQNIEESGIELFVTDATWDDEIRLRVVTVLSNEQRFAYEHELVVVPW